MLSVCFEVIYGRNRFSNDNSGFNIRLEKFEIENSVSLDSKNSDFSPTLGLELFLIQSEDITQIQKHLKDVLFKGVIIKTDLM